MKLENEVSSILSRSLLACFLQAKRNDAGRELQKASWVALDKGIDYISLSSKNATSADTMRYTVKGFIGEHINMSATAFDDLQPALYPLFTTSLNKKNAESTHGYLRVNLQEMTRPAILTAKIFLTNTYDTAEIAKFLPGIKAMKFVTDARIITKEEAKKLYMDDGNEDWSKVLDFNPLPNVLLVSFDNEMTNQDLDTFAFTVKHSLPFVLEVDLPSAMLLKTKEQYYILEYERK